MRFTVWAPSVALNLVVALLPLQHSSALAWLPLAGSGAAMCAIVALPLAISYQQEGMLRAQYLAGSRQPSR